TQTSEFASFHLRRSASMKVIAIPCIGLDADNADKSRSTRIRLWWAAANCRQLEKPFLAVSALIGFYPRYPCQKYGRYFKALKRRRWGPASSPRRRFLSSSYSR